MTKPLPYHHVMPNPYDTDAGHLRTLAICHYVWGGVTIVFSAFFLIHIAMGIAILNGSMPFPMPPAPPGAPPGTAFQSTSFFAWFFIGFGSVGILLGWTSGVLTIVSGRCLAKRKSRTFSLVMAGVNCLAVPVGTVLGVFTFIVLFRPTVQAVYDHQRQVPEPSP